MRPRLILFYYRIFVDFSRTIIVFYHNGEENLGKAAFPSAYSAVRLLIPTLTRKPRMSGSEITTASRISTARIAIL